MKFEPVPPGGTVPSPAGGTVRGSSLLAGDADRQATVSSLQAAFVDGRLTRGELDVRVEAALTGRTYAQLAGAMRDLPGPVPGAGPGFGAAPAAPLPGPVPGRAARALVLCVPAVFSILCLTGHSAAIWALHHYLSAPGAAFAAGFTLIDVALVFSILRGLRPPAPDQQ